MNLGHIEIFEPRGYEARVEVRFEEDTIWLTQKQMAEVFGTKRPAITKHLSNIFKSGELSEVSGSSILEHTTQHGAIKGKIQHTKTKFYNLDTIISVGYRVNSQRATAFRMWATKTLKKHLVEGYTLNEKRLRQVSGNIAALEKTIRLIEKSGKADELQLSEAKGLLEIITGYTRSFVILNQFDSQDLDTRALNEEITYEIKYQEAVHSIRELKQQLIDKKEASALFGNEKDESFKGILGSVVQTFDGVYLYPSIEEQAAHLLYFTIKTHPFSDGNKRIGAFLFVWFLEKNRHRFKKGGEVKINDNGLVALALLVAQSDPAEKELIVKLIINLVKG
jgi:death-on-curing family protein